MKRFIKYLAGVLVVTFIFMSAACLSILLRPRNVFHSSYQSMIQDKFRVLKEMNDPKIIMISGSSSAFGLNQYLLEKETGYKVANLGLHAGFGAEFETELAKANINPGDIVLLGYEYIWFNKDAFSGIGSDLVMSGIDNHLGMYRYVPKDRLYSLLGYIFTYAYQKNNFGGANGVYSREAFDRNGQMTWPRYYALGDFSSHTDTYGFITADDGRGNVFIAPDVVDYLKNFKEYVESRGARIYFVSSPILYESISCSPDDFLKLARLEEELIGIPYISDPQSYMFPDMLVSNMPNHPNSYGELVRTQTLADDLKRCGAVDSPEFSNVLSMEQGETLVLRDTLPKRLIHDPHRVMKVYRYDEAGDEIVYKDGIDYVVDYHEGVIRRTADSSIPNYTGHKVSFQKGKFSRGNSINQNPEGNSPYMVRIDYSYYLPQRALEPIEDKSSFLGKSLRDKLLHGDDIKIALLGDDIGIGAGTDSKHIFINYLAENLKRIYGSNVSIDQASSSSATRALLRSSLDAIIKERPDAVLVELGLNDHNGSQLDEGAFDDFYKDMASSIDRLQGEGITVILIGFPQQNFAWDQESVDATRKYNEAMRKLAQEKQVYLADVFDVYQKAGLRKNLFEDVYADFLHCPTEWGHKLYMTGLMPVFNVSGKLNSEDIRNYVYMDK